MRSLFFFCMYFRLIKTHCRTPTRPIKQIILAPPGSDFGVGHRAVNLNSSPDCISAFLRTASMPLYAVGGCYDTTRESGSLFSTRTSGILLSHDKPDLCGGLVETKISKAKTGAPLIITKPKRPRLVTPFRWRASVFPSKQDVGSSFFGPLPTTQRFWKWWPHVESEPLGLEALCCDWTWCSILEVAK